MIYLASHDNQRIMVSQIARIPLGSWISGLRPSLQSWPWQGPEYQGTTKFYKSIYVIPGALPADPPCTHSVCVLPEPVPSVDHTYVWLYWGVCVGIRSHTNPKHSHKLENGNWNSEVGKWYTFKLPSIYLHRFVAVHRSNEVALA